MLQRTKLNHLVPVSVIFTIMFLISSYADGWQYAGNGNWQYIYSGNYAAHNEWIWAETDYNGNPGRNCYYFGADTYLLRNSVAPDGREVGENGGWVNKALLSNPDRDKINTGTLIPANIAELQEKLNSEIAEHGYTPSLYTCCPVEERNGIVTRCWLDNDGSTLAVMKTNEKAGMVTENLYTETVPIDRSGRYTVIPYPTEIVPENGLQGSYTLYGSTCRQIILSSLGYYQMSKYHHPFVYRLNDETLVMGGAYGGGGGAESGEWVIDNTKPDAMYGKTNIRFRYANGTFAGYGSHDCITPAEWTEENRQAWISGNKNRGKFSYCFTEDGYLLRNSYVTFWPDIEGCRATYMFGSVGGWLDRPAY